MGGGGATAGTFAGATSLDVRGAANSIGNNLNASLQNAAYRQADLQNSFPDIVADPHRMRPSTVAQTAASRVQKSAWEAEQDAKDAELDEWLASVKGDSDE